MSMCLHSLLDRVWNGAWYGGAGEEEEEGEEEGMCLGRDKRFGVGCRAAHGIGIEVAGWGGDVRARA